MPLLDHSRRFVIPKKTYATGDNVTAPLLEEVPIESETFRTLYQPIFMVRLSPHCHQKQLLKFNSCKIIHNRVLEDKFKRYRDKLADEECSRDGSYAFLAMSSNPREVELIAQHGLFAGNFFVGDLGDCEKGVYLNESPDLVVPSPFIETTTLTIMAFKIMKGRTKSVGLSSFQLAPSPGYHSHVPKSPQPDELLNRHSYHRYNQVFLYETLGPEEWAQVPSGVLPFAVYSVSFPANSTPPYKIAPYVVWSGSIKFGAAVYGGVQLYSAGGIFLKPPTLDDCLEVTSTVDWAQCVGFDPIRNLLSPPILGELALRKELTLSRLQPPRNVSWFTLRSLGRDPGFEAVHESMRYRRAVGVSVLLSYGTLMVIPNSQFSSLLSLPVYEGPVFHVLHFSSTASESLVSGSFEPLTADEMAEFDRAPFLEELVDGLDPLVRKVIQSLAEVGVDSGSGDDDESPADSVAVVGGGGDTPRVPHPNESLVSERNAHRVSPTDMEIATESDEEVTSACWADDPILTQMPGSVIASSSVRPQPSAAAQSPRIATDKITPTAASPSTVTASPGSRVIVAAQRAGTVNSRDPRQRARQDVSSSPSAPITKSFSSSGTSKTVVVGSSGHGRLPSSLLPLPKIPMPVPPPAPITTVSASARSGTTGGASATASSKVTQQVTATTTAGKTASVGKELKSNESSRLQASLELLKSLDKHSASPKIRTTEPEVPETRCYSPSDAISSGTVTPVGSPPPVDSPLSPADADRVESAKGKEAKQRDVTDSDSDEGGLTIMTEESPASPPPEEFVYVARAPTIISETNLRDEARDPLREAVPTYRAPDISFLPKVASAELVKNFQLSSEGVRKLKEIRQSLVSDPTAPGSSTTSQKDSEGRERESSGRRRSEPPRDRDERVSHRRDNERRDDRRAAESDSKQRRNEDSRKNEDESPRKHLSFGWRKKSNDDRSERSDRREKDGGGRSRTPSADDISGQSRKPRWDIAAPASSSSRTDRGDVDLRSPSSSRRNFPRKGSRSPLYSQSRRGGDQQTSSDAPKVLSNGDTDHRNLPSPKLLDPLAKPSQGSSLPAPRLPIPHVPLLPTPQEVVPSSECTTGTAPQVEGAATASTVSDGTVAAEVSSSVVPSPSPAVQQPGYTDPSVAGRVPAAGLPYMHPNWGMVGPMSGPPGFLGQYGGYGPPGAHYGAGWPRPMPYGGMAMMRGGPAGYPGGRGSRYPRGGGNLGFFNRAPSVRLPTRPSSEMLPGSSRVPFQPPPPAEFDMANGRPRPPMKFEKPQRRVVVVEDDLLMRELINDDALKAIFRQFMALKKRVNSPVEWVMMLHGRVYDALMFKNKTSMTVENVSSWALRYMVTFSEFRGQNVFARLAPHECDNGAGPSSNAVLPCIARLVDENANAEASVVFLSGIRPSSEVGRKYVSKGVQLCDIEQLKSKLGM